MKYYANIETGYVTEVIVTESTDGLDGEWLETTKDGSMRKNYAGIGFFYDETRDAFIPPQPFPSWVLDEGTCQYDSPIPYPDDDKKYTWDEASVSWMPFED